MKNKIKFKLVKILFIVFGISAGGAIICNYVNIKDNNTHFTTSRTASEKINNNQTVQIKANTETLVHWQQKIDKDISFNENFKKVFIPYDTDSFSISSSDIVSSVTQTPEADKTPFVWSESTDIDPVNGTSVSYQHDWTQYVQDSISLNVVPTDEHFKVNTKEISINKIVPFTPGESFVKDTKANCVFGDDNNNQKIYTGIDFVNRLLDSPTGLPFWSIPQEEIETIPYGIFSSRWHGMTNYIQLQYLDNFVLPSIQYSTYDIGQLFNITPDWNGKTINVSLNKTNSEQTNIINNLFDGSLLVNITYETYSNDNQNGFVSHKEIFNPQDNKTIQLGSDTSGNYKFKIDNIQLESTCNSNIYLKGSNTNNFIFDNKTIISNDTDKSYTIVPIEISSIKNKNAIFDKTVGEYTDEEIISNGIELLDNLNNIISYTNSLKKYFNIARNPLEGTTDIEATFNSTKQNIKLSSFKHVDKAINNVALSDMDGDSLIASSFNDNELFSSFIKGNLPSALSSNYTFSVKSVDDENGIVNINYELQDKLIGTFKVTNFSPYYIKIKNNNKNAVKLSKKEADKNWINKNLIETSPFFAKYNSINISVVKKNKSTNIEITYDDYFAQEQQKITKSIEVLNGFEWEWFITLGLVFVIIITFYIIKKKTHLKF